MKPVLIPVSAINCRPAWWFCSTIFSTVQVFFADSSTWMSRLGLSFKASFASMKRWWHIFIVNNSHSSLYTLWLNVLQCQKFYNCMIADLAKLVVMSNQLFSMYWIWQSKQADDKKFWKYTNKKPLLKLVTFSHSKVQRKVARLKTFWLPLLVLHCTTTITTAFYGHCTVTGQPEFVGNCPVKTGGYSYSKIYSL